MSEPFFESIFRKLRLCKVLPQIPNGSTVCDVGCGSGGFLLKSVQDRIIRGYGFDNLVENRESGNLIFTKLNLDREPLPLDDSSVDLATALAVLEHFENPLFILQEIHRILKPGGILLLTTPTPAAKPILEFLAYRLHLISKREIDEHKHYFNREELMDTHIRAGFHEDKISISLFEAGFNSFVRAEK